MGLSLSPVCGSEGFGFREIRGEAVVAETFLGIDSLEAEFDGVLAYLLVEGFLGFGIEEVAFAASGHGHELAHEGDGEKGAKVLIEEVECADAVLELSRKDEVSDEGSRGGSDFTGGIPGAEETVSVHHFCNGIQGEFGVTCVAHAAFGEFGVGELEVRQKDIHDACDCGDERGVFVSGGVPEKG